MLLVQSNEALNTRFSCGNVELVRLQRTMVIILKGISLLDYEAVPFGRFIG